MHTRTKLACAENVFLNFHAKLQPPSVKSQMLSQEYERGQTRNVTGQARNASSLRSRRLDLSSLNQGDKPEKLKDNADKDSDWPNTRAAIAE